jgi:hypothetical protein
MRSTTWTAIGRIRSSSRVASRQAWSKTTGLLVDIRDRVDLDTSRAWMGGDALARQWDARRAQAVADGIEPAAAMRQAVVTIDYAVERTATTETVDAFNDETETLADVAYARGIVVVQTWEGILDQRTCPECEALEGVSMTRPERFDERPPLHPLCRCFLSTWTLDAGAVAA